MRFAFTSLVLLALCSFGCSSTNGGSDDGVGAASGVGGTGMNGVGGSGTGSGGVDGAGGSGTGTGGSVAECTPVTSRCDCVAVADGVSSQIDAFEDADMRINVVDNRDGEWFQAKSRNGGANLGTMAVEATSSGAPGSTKALHMSGGPTTLTPAMGEPDDWATFGVPLGVCYDASPYSGIGFWIKGTTSAGNESVRFSISTPPTTESSAGGTCPDGDTGCYNHFGADIILTSTWTYYSFTWAELAQNATWGIKVPAGYEKEKNVLAINFAPFLNTEGYDFWIDDVVLTTEGGGHCGNVVSSAQFSSFFPNKNAFYTYDGFVEAAQQFPAFCGQGSEDDRKRDAAAFLANVVQETGGLVYLEEISPPMIYCAPERTDFPCAGGKSYHGRGPMQLSWNYNYGTAGQSLGLPLLSNPELVVASAANSFKAGIWFWMTRQPLVSPHTQITSGKGFGETIRLVNGPLECDGKEPTKVQNRINAYVNFCGQLGVEPGDNQGC